MSLLPPPPAPQQQRHAVGAPAARGRGLYSDAVGLHPDVRIEPSLHPTTSVGLHDGPKFAPQHRAVAAPAALDIGAMVAARLSTPEPVLSTATTEFDGTYDEPKSKAAPAEPMSAEPEPATRRGSMVAARLSAGYKEMNEEDKLTGMDAYDYGMFSNEASYALETKQKKTLFGKKKETTSTVYFKMDNKPVARSVVLEDKKHKLPNDTHGIALVATVDKNWKGDRFQVDKVDKVKVFGTGAVNKYPVAYNAKHNELMTVAYAVYEDLRKGWVESFKLTKPDGKHDVDNVEMLGGRFVDKKKTKYKLDGEGLHVSKETVTLENIVPAVAKLQNDAQTHTTFTTGARGGTTKSDEEGPSDLSMGSAETVSIEEAKNIDYIAHLVGDGFLTYLKTSLARDPDNDAALEELKKTAADNGDELDRPFVIPVDSGYSTKDVGARKYLEELGFVGVGKLETLSGLLVVPMPTPADAGAEDRQKIFGNSAGLAKMRWERIFPGEFAPLMPVAGQGNQYLDVNVLKEGKYELQDEYGKLLYGTLMPKVTPDNKYQDGDVRQDSLATLGQKLAEQTVALSAKKKGEELEAQKAEIEETKATMRTIQTQLEQIWGAPRPPLRAKPSGADMTFTLNDEYSRRKFACAVFGLHAAPGGEMKISKRPLLMPRVSNEPISVAHIQRIWALGPAAADETKPAGGGVELHNALPMAMRGEGLDLRFLWCAMKIAQRCMNNAMGVTRKSSVGNVLVGLKGNKSISTETKSKYRMLLGVENYADATKSRDEMKVGEDCCDEMDFEELSEAAQLALLEDQL